MNLLPVSLIVVACLAQGTLGAKPAPPAQTKSAPAVDAVPDWIWWGPAEGREEVLLRRTFDLDAAPQRASVSGTCDNHMTVVLNGETVLTHGTWERVATQDVSSALVAGSNVLEVRARNEGGPAGLALRLKVGNDLVIVTDAAWEGTSATASDGGSSEWASVRVLGPVGDGALPWTSQVGTSNFGLRTTAPREPRTQAVHAAEGLHLLDGFEAELLYTVPRDTEGSWVALTKDDRGRLYASDQGGKGIYRITPAAIDTAGATTRVERVDVGVSGAQGMCWAFDSLYVNVNGQGLWRIRDTDGDDQLDSAENLIPLGNGGEHGPHAVMKTQDGQGLYFIAGNHTEAPPFQGSRAPSNWREDLLLPRLWDARGHARGILAPGGWIARCDPDGKNIEIVSSGYRNQYDIAVDANGEMFTYDADMEWDIGLPWYRPTRVCHVTSGSEFGWRSGTGKWPAYYEDSLPPVLDIGPGSPTGITFGTGAKFPARYQRALFILDWTFGTIYALHLEPKGSSFVATKEDFVWSKPLAVTDTVIGDDGAMYFAVGGRGSASALYRIVYRGQEATVPVGPLEADGAAEARALRHQLEAFHGHEDPTALDAAWPHLASTDRFVRFAARIAVENQPVATWRARALAERRPQAAVAALTALARQGAPEDLASIVAALGRNDLRVWLRTPAFEPQVLGVLRAYELAFARLGPPDDALRLRALGALEPLFPGASNAVNSELAALLTYLRSPTVVAKTLAQMALETPTELPPWAELIQRNDSYGGPIAKMLDNMPPLQDIHYALVLRNATEGWTLPMRKAYFDFFPEAAQHPGGMSYGGFLENIRADAEDTLSPSERRSLATSLGRSLIEAIAVDVTPPQGPGREWTVAAASAALGAQLSGRDYDRGRNLFHATSCSACHRFDGEGGAIGPDLTTVANKFSLADLLEAIVEPSKVISDQYGSHIVMDKDGQIAEGIMVEDGEELRVYLRDYSAEPVVFERADVTAIRESPLSQMPAGLLDSLNPEELKDLVAFLMSGGDKRSAVFRE
ncbi:MAG: c-type cytochrome [Planctomycetota bacterium]